jgi:hypothetical protein
LRFISRLVVLLDSGQGTNSSAQYGLQPENELPQSLRGKQTLISGHFFSCGKAHLNGFGRIQSVITPNALPNEIISSL